MDDFVDSGRGGLNRPSIWQYAKNAGLRTILLDPFPGDRRVYINPNEWPWIDRYISLYDAPTYERDKKIAEILVKLLSEDEPSFIFVNKFGVHFPYEINYPEKFNKFLVMGEAGPISEESRANLNNPTELLSSYNNALLWSVDGFFEKLFNRIEWSRALLIYTSDHGQSLLEGGQRAMHCTTTNTQRGEGLVPLFAVTEAPLLSMRLREAAGRLLNRSTHFEIFPTLLWAMGYEEPWISEHYGATLLERVGKRPRQFLIGGNNSVNWFDGAKWVVVD